MRSTSWVRAASAAFAIGALVGFLFIATGCGTGAGSGSAGTGSEEIDVELSFEPAPQVGDTTCRVRLHDPGGAPIGGATVEVEGNMNHAGMVPVFGEAAESAPGLYEAPLEFTMGGDWFVIVRAELADGGKLERIVDVPGVRPAGSDASAKSGE